MMPCHKFCSMKVRVLRPFCARFSILTEPSRKNFGSASPQPVSGRFSGSFFASVESPARKTVTGSLADAFAASAESKNRSKKCLVISLIAFTINLTARARPSCLRVPAVRAAENSPRRDCVGFRLRQPSRPRDARRRFRARPLASELRVTDALLALGKVPVVPAFGPHDFRHLRIDERHGRVRAPRASEVSPDFGRRTRDAAVRKDEAEGLVVRRRGRRKIPVLQGAYVATLEEGRRRAEDEIDVPFDVATLEVLSPAVEKDRVLPPEEAAVSEGRAVAVNAQRERLPNGAGGVLEGDVLGREVVGVYLCGRRAEGADGLAV